MITMSYFNNNYAMVPSKQYSGKAEPNDMLAEALIQVMQLENVDYKLGHDAVDLLRSGRVDVLFVFREMARNVYNELERSTGMYALRRVIETSADSRIDSGAYRKTEVSELRIKDIAFEAVDLSIVVHSMTAGLTDLINEPKYETVFNFVDSYLHKNKDVTINFVEICNLILLINK